MKLYRIWQVNLLDLPSRLFLYVVCLQVEEIGDLLGHCLSMQVLVCES